MADALFLDRIAPASQLHLLFDALPDLCMFAKDVEGRLRVVNQALLRRFGARHEKEVLGKTDFDILPRGLAEKFRIDDQRVMESRKPLLRLHELFLDARGVPTWHVTNKFPIFSRKGDVLGVMGTIESDDARGPAGMADQALHRAFDYIRENCATPLSVPALAESCGLSVRQFERRFRDQLRMSPRDLIMRMRVQRACGRLRRSKERIAEVSLACGFYDQADFSRQFRKQVGMTPGEYRRRYG